MKKKSTKKPQTNKAMAHLRLEIELKVRAIENVYYTYDENGEYVNELKIMRVALAAQLDTLDWVLRNIDFTKCDL